MANINKSITSTRYNQLRYVLLVLILTSSQILAQFCEEPDWFVPYGSHVGDIMWQGAAPEVVSLPADIQYTPFGLSGGENVQVTLKTDPLGSVQLSSRRHYITLYTAFPPPIQTYFLDGFQSAVFLGQHTDNETLTWATDHLGQLAGLGDVYPTVEVQYVLTVTYHCVRLSSRPTQPSTFQLIVVFGGPRMFLFYNFASLVFGDSLSETAIDPGNIPNALFTPLLSDDEMAEDPSSYTKATNMGKPFLTIAGGGAWNSGLRDGHWGVYLSANPPYIPRVLNPWGPWECAVCGGCGQRSRVYNGRVEYDFGPCPRHRQCSPLVHPKRESIRNPRGIIITRMRRCCYDYRVVPPQPLIIPQICHHVNGWDWRWNQ